MLGGCEDIEPGIVGEDRQLSHLIEHLLIPLRVPANRAEPFPILDRAGHCGKNEEHELHNIPPRGLRAGIRAETRTRSVSIIAPISRSGPSRTKSAIRRSANGERLARALGPVNNGEVTFQPRTARAHDKLMQSAARVGVWREYAAAQDVTGGVSARRRTSARHASSCAPSAAKSGALCPLRCFSASVVAQSASCWTTSTIRGSPGAPAASNVQRARLRNAGLKSRMPPSSVPPEDTR